MAASTIAPAQKVPVGWSVNASNADLSGCEIVVAAPATGLSLHLSKLSVFTVADVSVTVGFGETTSAVTAAGIVLGPVSLGANGSTSVDFEPPIAGAAATALVADASGAGVVTVVAQGETK